MDIDKVTYGLNDIKKCLEVMLGDNKNFGIFLAENLKDSKLMYFRQIAKEINTPIEQIINRILLLENNNNTFK